MYAYVDTEYIEIYKDIDIALYGRYSYSSISLYIYIYIFIIGGKREKTLISKVMIYIYLISLYIYIHISVSLYLYLSICILSLCFRHLNQLLNSYIDFVSWIFFSVRIMSKVFPHVIKTLRYTFNRYIYNSSSFSWTFHNFRHLSIFSRFPSIINTASGDVPTYKCLVIGVIIRRDSWSQGHDQLKNFTNIKSNCFAVGWSQYTFE